ncbi:alpha-S1-casein isoform X39 [Mesocricetus auratus]|uniref:Alpha-S1-casein n=1 Tax=Mesocricetus auratus TaxID=10036 RepID=A0ABM2XKJ6_MESAU|nr:alpha-S1-casein isoform X38 [Mesocricetus auratus]XP_040603282.1 alpha-S1-casein isoform X39 [Mesocricetus auratus]
MKLLILTCLVAAALAMPRLHLKNAVHFQNQHQDSSEEQQKFVELPTYLGLYEKLISVLNRRELLTGEQSDEIQATMDESTEEQAMGIAQQQDDSSSISSSEESENAIPSNSETKHISSEDILNQCTLEQLKRQIKCSQLCQQATLAQQACLAEQVSLAKQACLAQQASLAQQACLAQQVSLAQQASLAQEQPYKMSAYNQFQMGQPMSAVDQKLVQLFVQAFPQFYQYPLWAHLPQEVQHFTPESVLNTVEPIGPNNEEGTKVW